MAKQKSEPTKKTTHKEKDKFTKQILINSKQYSRTERDMLKLILVDDKKYSLDEVNKAIKKFKGGI